MAAKLATDEHGDGGSTAAKPAPDEHGDKGNTAARTLFVRNLPYSLTDSQLQEVFGEIGPVRRSFIVKEKGSEQHRGFGFVQFAVVEDAVRAVEAKNGTELHGRKIKVELAKRRAPLEQRRSKKKNDVDMNIVERDSSAAKEASTNAPVSIEENSKKRKSVDAKHTVEAQRKKKRKRVDAETAVDGQKEKVIEHGEFHSLKDKKKGHKPTVVVERKSSEKQRVARTVVLGGLVTPEMSEEAIDLAKKVGVIESIQSSLSVEELKGRGLEKDGCKLGAAAVVYTSVKDAMCAVALLHQKVILGHNLWARQLGGEGSKPRKWRVIIRNLPFKIMEEEIRGLFTNVGFVWEITIPRKDDGQSKGFAFASFISRAHAEKAISTVNGKLVGKRPIAVDWAVEKKLYNTVKSTEAPEAIQKSEPSDLEEEEETASEGDDDDSFVEKEIKESSTIEEADSQEELDMTMKVLNKVVTSSSEKDHSDKNVKKPDDKLHLAGQKPVSTETGREPELEKKNAGVSKKPEAGSGGELEQTVFIKNLPFEADAEAVKRHFQQFGKVKSIHLVRHPLTQRPRGTAFLKFATKEAAEAAVVAASGASSQGKVTGGIIFEGRNLDVLMAVDKKSAEALKTDKLENDNLDRRNLYLAKEGKIEGTAAAVGVSEEDMQKRKQLEHEKATKLRSPNFHVSRTRLAVYNVPKSMTEADLRSLFINAVKSRATKQQPVVKQVKILRDKKTGKQRGAAFVEFTEHQHALGALRVLNNNPETFSRDRRPIVGFAIENLQTMKKRQERQSGAENLKFKANGSRKEVEGFKKANLRLSKDEKPDHESAAPSLREESQVPQNYTDKAVKSGKLRGKKRKRSSIQSLSEVGELAKVSGKKRHNIEPHLSFPSRADSVFKVGNSDRTPIISPKGGNKSSHVKTSNKKDNIKVHPGKNKEGSKKKGDNPSQDGIAKGKKFGVESPMKPHEKKRRKRNSKPEIVDKLDKLVAEYRNRFMAGPSSGRSDHKERASSDLKRWFE